MSQPTTGDIAACKYVVKGCSRFVPPSTKTVARALTPREIIRSAPPESPGRH